MIRAILSLASELGVDVVAEGVETEAQRALLVAASAQAQGQGFYYSRAVSAEESMRHAARRGRVTERDCGQRIEPRAARSQPDKILEQINRPVRWSVRALHSAHQYMAGRQVAPSIWRSSCAGAGAGPPALAQRCRLCPLRNRYQMWIVRLALRRPYTFIVLARADRAARLVHDRCARRPTSFPTINIPVVSTDLELHRPAARGHGQPHRRQRRAHAHRPRQ